MANKGFDLVVSVFLAGFIFAIGFGLACTGFVNTTYYFPSMSSDVAYLINVLGVEHHNIVKNIINIYWESSFFALFLGLIIMLIGLASFLFTLNKVKKALATK